MSHTDVVTEPVRTQEDLQATPYRSWLKPDGSPWAHFFRFPDRYLVRFPALADFELPASGASVRCFPAPGTLAATLEHLWINQVKPLVLSRQGHLMLHGSAVCTGEGCVAFLGASGRGKSTLAASFARMGLAFLTDDGLQVTRSGDDLWAVPGHASVRLWESSATALLPGEVDISPPLEFTAKSRALAGAALPHCDSPRRIDRVFFLGDGSADAPAMQPVPRAEAMLELVRHSFLLDTGGRETLESHFGAVAGIASRDIYWRLDYPRRFEVLPLVRDMILDAVA